MSDFLTDKFVTNLIKKVGYTSKKYKLLEPDDRVLIGVSGGKDSLFLLEALANRIRHLPFKVKLIACHIHIKEVGYKIDVDFLQQRCNCLGIELFIEELSVNLTANPNKVPCFVCSWHRRKRLFEMIHKYNCNKLALGHHADDAIETLLMNMVYHASISSMPAKLSMFEGRVQLIRPMIELINDDLKKVAAICQFPVLKSECPHGDDTLRNKSRQLVEQLALLNKNARKNIFNSMDRIYTEYLPNGFNRINNLEYD